LTVLQIVAQTAPHHFGLCYAWFDELYTVFELFLQQHFLKNHSASFAEYYYGLQRKRVADTENVCSSFFKVQKVKALVALVIFPYLQLKFEKQFEKIKENYELDLNRTISSVKKLLYWIYPCFHIAWNVLILYHNFMFTVGKTKFHSPFYKALGIQLVVCNEPYLMARCVLQCVFVQLTLVCELRP